MDISKLGSIANAEVLLYCPSCGGDYLHHSRVEVYERAEDADAGQHLTVDCDKVHSGVAGMQTTFDNDLTGNPSPRRSGLKIHFVCENCSHTPILSIYQHKGQSAMQLD